MVHVWIEAFGETSQGVGFSHARSCREYPDAPCFLQEIQAGGHLLEIIGAETVVFRKLLFVKRVGMKSVKGIKH